MRDNYFAIGNFPAWPLRNVYVKRIRKVGKLARLTLASVAITADNFK